jgi:hypothetical protein
MPFPKCNFQTHWARSKPNGFEKLHLAECWDWHDSCDSLHQDKTFLWVAVPDKKSLFLPTKKSKKSSNESNL